MRDIVKTDLAKALCNPPDPHNVTVKDIYPHYVTFWDQVCEKWHLLLGNPEPPRNDRAMIVAIADALHERDERIATLEQQMDILLEGATESVGEPENATQPVGEPTTVTDVPCSDVRPPPPNPNNEGGSFVPFDVPPYKVDMRTREGREMKKQQAEAVGV